ncbi:pheromone receptor a1 [Malassezia pachydermatis]|uniref:Pheromone receptor a1 n=1 Tax=Malassezia pachydermatis TaxID=77020 RepID=A0A0M9VQT0_9BASI|nr:pheromone receptor a1 [Malassezia pachydermatis]KOS15863.1 pheromone receptor a1 [Malassezia pachydermatis]
MVTMGVPCCALIISMKLLKISSLNYIPQSEKQILRQRIHDIGCVLVLPILYALLTLINQGHRFNIVEGQGCQPAVYLTALTIVIDYGMPLTQDFDIILRRSGTGLSTKKFLRMISFTLIDLLLNFPTFLTDFALELSYSKIHPYTSWDLVHSGFSNIWIYPISSLANKAGQQFLILSSFSSWTLCVTAIIFFLLFGFSVDVRLDYSKAQKKIASFFLKQKERTLPLSCSQFDSIQERKEDENSLQRSSNVPEESKSIDTLSIVTDPPSLSLTEKHEVYI